MMRAFVTRLLAASTVLAVLGGSAFAGEVELTWERNPEPGVAGYIVWYGTQPGIYKASVDVGNRTGWTLTGLQEGQRYYFAVQAYDSSRIPSPLSAEVFADVTSDAENQPPSKSPKAGSSKPSADAVAGLAGEYYIHHPVRGSWLTGWVTMRPSATDAARMDVFKGTAGHQEKIGEWLFGEAETERTFVHTGSVAEPNPSSTTDLVVWQASSGKWFFLNSNDGITYASRLVVTLGLALAGDTPVPGDYDGDGRPDVGVWRPSTGDWSVLLSAFDYDGNHRLQRRWGLGTAGDVPVPADYDGDRLTDLAVWRAPTGDWYVLKSSNAYSDETALTINLGQGSRGDVPVPGDYDGDGKADPAVWRAPTGDWYVLLSSDAYQDRSSMTVNLGIGSAGDMPMPGDYDGDGKTEPGVWRAPAGKWLPLASTRESPRADDRPVRR